LTRSKRKGPAGLTSTARRYRLKFVPPVLKEWEALDGSVKEALRSILRKRLDNPHVPGSRLHGGLANCYKIKLRKQGYRLVYTVEDDVLIVLVLAVDKREDSAAYKSAIKRLLAQLTQADPADQ
jgi:mRNA interferase RelE/StbE